MKYLIGLTLFIAMFSFSCTSMPRIKEVSEPTSTLVFRIYENYDGKYDPGRIPKEWTPYEWYPCPGGQNHTHVNLIPSKYNKESFNGYMSILVKKINTNTVLIIAYSYIENGVRYVFEYDINLDKYKQNRPTEA